MATFASSCISSLHWPMDLFLIQRFDSVDKRAIVSVEMIVFVRADREFSTGITHTDMTQLGFIQSLTRFFLDKEVDKNDADLVQKIQGQHTIDELYQLVYPSWSTTQVKLHSYPLKRIIDLMQVKNALVDLSRATKKLSAAHFDSESFAESNRRIIDLRSQGIVRRMSRCIRSFVSISSDC
jgi:hypothetical protein